MSICQSWRTLPASCAGAPPGRGWTSAAAWAEPCLRPSRSLGRGAAAAAAPPHTPPPPRPSPRHCPRSHRPQQHLPPVRAARPL